MNEQRRCSGPCKEWLPLFMFVRDSTCTAGYAYKCKTCKNKEQAERKAAIRAANPDAPKSDDPVISAEWYLHSPKLPVFVGGFGAAVIGRAA